MQVYSAHAYINVPRCQLSAHIISYVRIHVYADLPSPAMLTYQSPDARKCTSCSVSVVVLSLYYRTVLRCRITYSALLYGVYASTAIECTPYTWYPIAQYDASYMNDALHVLCLTVIRSFTSHCLPLPTSRIATYQSSPLANATYSFTSTLRSLHSYHTDSLY